MTTETLFSILVRGAALMGLVGVGVLALRRAAPAHRHLTWTLGAIALLALPVFVLTLPEIAVPLLAPAARAPQPGATVILPAAPLVTIPKVDPAALANDPDGIESRRLTAWAERHSVHAREFETPRSRIDLADWAVALWIAGASLLTLRLLAATIGVRRIVRSGDPAADARVLAVSSDAAKRLGLRRAPPVLASSEVDAPLTIGVLRPSVVLPLEALAWDEERLRLALLHEFAHVARRDLLAEIAARLATIVHWPNPLTWLAVARLRIERERACDDAVLAAGGGASEYAGFLVSLARSLSRRPSRFAVAATMAGGPQFERRVRAILDGGGRRLAPSPRMGVSLAFVTALALSFAACVHPTQRSGDDTAAPPAAASGDADQMKALETLGYVAGAKPVVVTVAGDGSGTFRSVSAALESAPAGAVVRIGPGTFDGHVVVTRPVTIEGAGTDETTLLSDAGSPGSPLPTLLVGGVRGVAIRGLTMKSRGGHAEGTPAPGAVVDLSNAEILLENVAIVGGPGSGVVVGQGSQVTIDRSFVAAVWNTGIVVGPPGERPSNVRIANTDIRNCWSRGITVAPGNRGNVTIEACRISGSSWHGIRYDDASPVVRGNYIFHNVRSGIYASGDTHGTIRDNVFLENGMSDVSCWTAAKDVIEANAFVRSRREAVAILGGSAPVLRSNVFSNCRTAILATDVADGGRGSKYAGGGEIVSNVFHANEADFRRMKTGGGGLESAELPPGNVVLASKGPGDPGVLVHAPSQRAGVEHPLPSVSPWPLRGEEGATAPRAGQESKSSAVPPPAKPSAEAVSSLASAKSAVLQIQDPALRERGLAAIAEMMRSPDPAVARPALASLYELRDVVYDKGRFRPEVLAGLTNPDAGVRRAAAYAVLQLDRDPGDLELVLSMLEAMPVPSDDLLFVALDLSGNRAEGRLEKLYVKALAVDDPAEGAMNTANNLRRMWVSPAVEDAVVAAWRRHPTGRNGSGMWPYVFGQITSPARESRVRAIFEMMAGGDDAIRQLAGVAVTRRVDESARAAVSRLAAEAIPVAKTSALRRTYIDVLAANGTAADAPTLRALADNAMLGDDVRAAAGKAADQLAR